MLKLLEWACNAEARDCCDGHAVCRVDGREPGLAEECEACDAKERVEHVGDVAWAVCDPAVGILCVQDERAQRVRVDPVQPAEHAQRREHPPAVAHVLELLWAPIQAATRHLALAQPPCKPVVVDAAECAQDRERADAREHLCRMALGAGCRAKAAIKVRALHDPCGRARGINMLERAEVRKRRHCAVQEARVRLAPAIASERAIGILQRRDERDYALAPRAKRRQSIDDRKHLHRTQRAQHVRVVPRERRIPAILLAEAAVDKRNECTAVECIRRVHQRKCRKPPVHTVHAQVRTQVVRETRIAPLLEPLDEAHMRADQQRHGHVDATNTRQAA